VSFRESAVARFGRATLFVEDLPRDSAIQPVSLTVATGPTFDRLINLINRGH
jgi:hypothetical protein